MPHKDFCLLASALLRMLFLDGVYVDDINSEGGQRFVPVSNHRVADITKLTHHMSVRIARYLSRKGLIEADAENSYLTESSSTGEMTDHQIYSIMYRISTGFQKGKKIYTSNPSRKTQSETKGCSSKASV